MKMQDSTRFRSGMADQPCGGVKWLHSCAGQRPSRTGTRFDRTALSSMRDLCGNRPLPTSLFVDMWSRSNMSVRRRRVPLYNFRTDVHAGRGASSCTMATIHRLFAFPSRFGTAIARTSSLLHLPSPFLLPLFDRILHGGNRLETTPLFLPRSE